MNNKPIILEEIIEAFDSGSKKAIGDSRARNLTLIYPPDSHFVMMKESLEADLYQELLRWGAKENLPISVISLVLYRDFDTGKLVFMSFGHLFEEDRPKSYPVKIDGEVIEIAKKKIQADRLLSELANKIEEKKRTKI
ncbi:conserved hypothetical protein [Burkholderia cenocepacia]|uniref:hypothetical protein n=1 Tax=Burkholderia cenocepacia TaxID=95486 RepID=UPI00192CD98C|nr:hypothetical protein [Burkholderia cenocepacia]CAD9227897.1 conserved hypothetical protein [Burkholderia cenocepacia]